MKSHSLKLSASLALSAAVTMITACDLGTYAKRVEAGGSGYVAPAALESAPEDEGDRKPSPAIGRWELHASATNAAVAKKVNPLMGGGPAEREKRAEAFLRMTMEFDLKADGTFTSREVLDSVEANYKGTWSLNGKEIEIKQTHENGQAKTDSISGTLKGGTMDLIHREGNINYPLILRRAR